MEPITILLVGMPRLMADIVMFGLQSHADMRVVGVVDSAAELVVEARRTLPDFLVLDLEDTRLPELCGDLFAERPQTRILGIERDGRTRRSMSCGRGA